MLFFCFLGISSGSSLFVVMVLGLIPSYCVIYVLFFGLEFCGGSNGAAVNLTYCEQKRDL